MGTAAGTRSGRAARVGRAVAASSVATVVALAAHVGAGGPVPPLPGVLAVLVLSWPPAMLLARRRAAPVGSASVIVLSEFAFHAVFDLLAVAGFSAPATAMPGIAGMAGGRPAGPMPPAGMVADGPMWAAHAAAAAATWLAWWRGEAAVRSVLTAAVRLARALLPVPVGSSVRIPAAVAVPAQRADLLPRRTALLTAHPRRGPPSAVVPV